MTLAWCSGSGRALPVPSDVSWDAASGQCPACGAELPLRRGQLPNHRARKCLVPGCRNWRVRAGLCKRHDADVVEPDPLAGVEVP